MFFTFDENGNYVNYVAESVEPQAVAVVPAIPNDFVIKTHVQTFVELDASENCQDKGYKAHWACSCGELYAADDNGDIVSALVTIAFVVRRRF